MGRYDKNPQYKRYPKMSLTAKWHERKLVDTCKKIKALVDKMNYHKTQIKKDKYGKSVIFKVTEIQLIER